MRPGSGTVVSPMTRSPLIQVEFVPPLAVPMVPVVLACRDSVVPPTLEMDLPVATVARRMFSAPKSPATVLAMSPGLLS